MTSIAEQQSYHQSLFVCKKMGVCLKTTKAQVVFFSITLFVSGFSHVVLNVLYYTLSTLSITTITNVCFPAGLWLQYSPAWRDSL
jgi:formate/nitrite transporter FocA (FNT family)